MYYLSIKCGIDLYELGDNLYFYFQSLEEAFDFAKQVLKVSNYEIKIGHYCGDEDE